MRYMGMSVDEWMCFVVLILPAMYLLNANESLWGGILAVGAFLGTTGYRKFKKMSENFLLKSHLIARGFWASPSALYPDLIHQKVGK